MKTYCLTVLMMGHNICFKGEIVKIIPILSLLPFSSGALDHNHDKIDWVHSD